VTTAPFLITFQDRSFSHCEGNSLKTEVGCELTVIVGIVDGPFDMLGCWEFVIVGCADTDGLSLGCSDGLTDEVG